LTRLTPGGDGRSPVSRDHIGAIQVELAADHPGFADTEYRARRDGIAALAVAWHPGEPVPAVAYTDVEHETWRIVCRELKPLWEGLASASFLEAAEELSLPRHRIPQLSEVSERLGPLTGFRYLPVAGLAPLRTFYTAFGDRIFWSTQYLRHHSQPLYTPEPDLCHELLGHANQLAHPALAGVYQAVADAAARVSTAEALAFLSKVFWFTIEFGVVRERGELRAYGAGLLSSFGEMQQFRSADIRPLDWAAMGTQPYDITHYQGVLYEVPSIAWFTDEFTRFLDSYDDDAYARLLPVGL
jgi:phenylalanine-4-hydroxylase